MRIGRRRRGLGFLVFESLSNQCFERVQGFLRVQVKHQPVLVRRYRLECEDLRQNCLLEVNHQTQYARCVLPYAYACNVRIIRLDLGDQLAQRRQEINAFDINGHARRVRNQELARLDFAVGLDGQTRVVLGGPDPHRQNFSAPGNLPNAQQQDQAAALQQLATGGFPWRHAAVRAAPVGVSACKLTRRS